MNKKKILIVDPVHKDLISSLKKDNYIVINKIGISKEKLKKLIVDVDAIILRSGLVLDSTILNKAKKLKLIARAGVGLDNIDIAYARRKKIKYFNVPSQSSSSVAEFAFGLIHSSARKIAYCDRLLRKNIWKKKDMYGFEISKKNLGIIGLGKVGNSVANLGKKYSMNILATVKNNNIKRKNKLKKKKINITSLSYLLKNSDFIVICVPLTRYTKNLISKRNMKQMKKNSILINISRGGVVNENDLYSHVKHKRIFASATDVYLHEKKFNKLFKLDNMLVTCHIGAMTYEAQKKIAIQVHKKLKKILK